MTVAAFAIAENVHRACRTYSHAEIAEAIEEESFYDHYPEAAFLAALEIKHENIKFYARRAMHSGQVRDGAKGLAMQYA